VVDSFDALTSDRAYRQSLTLKEALTILHQGRGSQWEPALVDAFIAMIELSQVPVAPAAWTGSLMAATTILNPITGLLRLPSAEAVASDRRPAEWRVS
jgi:hypothetical protein